MMSSVTNDMRGVEKSYFVPADRSFSLKGSNKSAQGNRPGNSSAINPQTLKGRDRDSFVAPLQGDHDVKNTP
jgi:hypothetical protein